MIGNSTTTTAIRCSPVAPIRLIVGHLALRGRTGRCFIDGSW